MGRLDRDVLQMAVERETLRVRIRALEDAVGCRLCRAARRDTLALPCNHFLYCGACLAGAVVCPACAVPLSRRQPLLLD